MENYKEKNQFIIEEESIKKHPFLGELAIDSMKDEVETSLDNFNEIYLLEREYKAGEYIKNWYLQPELEPVERALTPLYSPMHSVSSISNQFCKKITTPFLERDQDKAYLDFIQIEPSTIDEELALLINEDQFRDLHTELNDYLEKEDGQIIEDVHRRINQIKEADRNQFNDGINRSLERMLENGMHINIDPRKRQIIKEAALLAGEGILPITEYVKNDPILEVNKFMGSKISLAVHDFMDHIWLFNVLNEAGILDKYSEMFDSIGNPESTDIFKREGEIVASIAFGVRLFQTMPSAFEPVMNTSDIEDNLDKLLVNEELRTHHIDAYRKIKGLKKGSLEWQSLGFCYSNYITELDEQRRKHGKIKQRDSKTRKILGELNPMSADYLCFFIDAHHEIVSSNNKHLNVLYRFHILLEEFLRAIADDEVIHPIVINPQKLNAIDFTKTTLPSQRLQWLRKNYGFTATRDAIV